ncbi:MAG: hypothetical protein ACYCZN_04680 [Candidatus Dormibacteria bacterium]
MSSPPTLTEATTLSELAAAIGLQLDAHPAWDDTSLRQRAPSMGLAPDTLSLLAAVATPQDSARGLPLALAGLARIAPQLTLVLGASLTLARWQEAQRNTTPRMPYATRAPIARFLADVSPTLPPEVAGLLLRHLHALHERASAERHGYTLFLAASHLAADPEAVGLLYRGPATWPHAVDAVRRRPGLSLATLATYQAALRVALGVETHCTSALRLKPTPTVVRAPSSPPSARGSLQAALEAVDEQPGLAGILGDVEPQIGRTGRRQRGGLTTTRALGIPDGLGDCAPLDLARLIGRIRDAELDPSNARVLTGVFALMFITGWPAALFSALGTGGRVQLDSGLGQVQIEAAFYAEWVGVPGPFLRLAIDPHVATRLARLLGESESLELTLQGRPRPLTARHLHRALKWLNPADTVSIWMHDLRGAIWHQGRHAAWPPEVLALATTATDPFLHQPFHYGQFPQPVDVADLHATMLAAAGDGWREWRDLQEAPDGFGST